MLTIIEPAQFKTIPWKNGLGETTELAINDKASLDNFIWRLSIASVINDGVFSDFSGYHRNLVLIEGKGISLQHDDDTIDVLETVLDFASFNGRCKTLGKLLDGPIKDFNIITSHEKILPQVNCYIEPQQVVVKLAKKNLCFAYSLSNEMLIETIQADTTSVPKGNLAKLLHTTTELGSKEASVTITGENMIIVQLALKFYEN